MDDTYEANIDLSKSFIEILTEKPKNELEVGIIEFIGRHFSDQAIEQSLNNNLTIGEILNAADQAIEKEVLEVSEKKIDKKLQYNNILILSDIKTRQEETKPSSPEQEKYEAIERVLKIVKNTFPEKKVIDLESISKGFGAVKSAMENENQFIATNVKDIPASEIGNLNAPNTPVNNSQNKDQSREHS